MTELKNRRCQPCEGGVEPLSHAAATELSRQLEEGWQVDADGRGLRRSFRFKNFYHTMGFVNAVAYIANAEDHHPDLEIGYDYCRVLFTTHAINGLSDNDFICAAKVDALTQ
ncbi:MAG TPA: 4a-hydroxytetrahydrobiopterin dehydratase [Steroidobacteraceae bacterium]|nr:4a-hydroxytetrahydrobiopterin dehydratase [Steroidobacteraceae bacterium]